MAPLLAAAMNHAAAHPGLRSHLVGPNNESFSRHHLPSSSPQSSKRRCNLSFTTRSARVGSQNGVQMLSPSEIPQRDWFPSDFTFGAATSAYQVLFSSANVVLRLCYIYTYMKRNYCSSLLHNGSWFILYIYLNQNELIYVCVRTRAKRIVFSIANYLIVWYTLKWNDISW